MNRSIAIPFVLTVDAPPRWPDPARVFRIWLRLGLLAVVVLPEARGHHWLIGALPFWLVAVPALSLVQHRLRRRAAVRRDLTRVAT